MDCVDKSRAARLVGKKVRTKCIPFSSYRSASTDDVKASKGSSEELREAASTACRSVTNLDANVPTNASVSRKLNEQHILDFSRSYVVNRAFFQHMGLVLFKMSEKADRSIMMRVFCDRSMKIYFGGLTKHSGRQARCIVPPILLRE